MNALGAAPIDFVAPQSPTKVTAEAKATSVELRWTASRNADVAAYTVFRSPSANGSYDTIARGVTGPSFTDTEAKEPTSTKSKRWIAR